MTETSILLSSFAQPVRPQRCAPSLRAYYHPHQLLYTIQIQPTPRKSHKQITHPSSRESIARPLRPLSIQPCIQPSGRILCPALTQQCGPISPSFSSRPRIYTGALGSGGVGSYRSGIPNMVHHLSIWASGSSGLISHGLGPDSLPSSGSNAGRDWGPAATDCCCCDATRRRQYFLGLQYGLTLPGPPALRTRRRTRGSASGWASVLPLEAGVLERTWSMMQG